MSFQFGVGFDIVEKFCGFWCCLLGPTRKIDVKFPQNRFCIFFSFPFRPCFIYLFIHLSGHLFVQSAFVNKNQSLNNLVLNLFLFVNIILANPLIFLSETYCKIFLRGTL